MATPEDLEANAEFLKKVDGIVPVPGGPSRENYGNVALICETAVKQKVRAAARTMLLLSLPSYSNSSSSRSKR